MKLFYLLCFLFVSTIAYCQSDYNPLEPPNTFKSENNPYYWKNRLPHEGYWQQDVHYKIIADIDEKSRIINGEESLEYWNNSPDTLYEVFFHLYQNAFQPGSYYDNLYKNNKVKSRFGIYEHFKLGTMIESISINKSPANFRIDNTIMRVNLIEPILPGTKATFDIRFKTFFDKGSMRRRMKFFDSFGQEHFDGVHWYPRISVYDRKFGWTTDQHLGHEFYGDFGTFDVSLTFASNYIVEATGNLLNRSEVMPDSLRKALDIRNFKDKKWNEEPSIIIPYDSAKRKTWFYHAENVHDFAFTADPNYRIGETIVNGVRCISLVQEPHASKWQNAADFTAKVVDVYNKDFGKYAYHKIIVADAQDGMEYPMITLDGGKDPSYRGLLAHEVGHNWFFGMVGNNETYRAALDEGFTQFLTAWSLESIDGPYVVKNKPKRIYPRLFQTKELVRDSRVYLRYLSDAMKGNDPQLNTHSDDFRGKLRHGGGYGHVYYKTATMLYNLQYVLGDELFSNAMKHYFNQWKIAHPYFNDFRNSIIHYTKYDLNWFFDQWLETNKYIDYKISSVKKGKKGTYNLLFKRKGSMQMPLDFTITDKNNVQHKYHIPNKWYVKNTDATILPKWEGWGNVRKEYVANIKLDSKIKDLQIDPTDRLADVNKLNNKLKTPVDLSFDSRIWEPKKWRAYNLNWRPVFWYNSLDGIKTGIHINGDYMNTKHIFKLNMWYDSELYSDNIFEKNPSLPGSFEFNYSNDLFPIIKHATSYINLRSLDGLNALRAGITFQLKEKTKLSLYYRSDIRQSDRDLDYILLDEQWQKERYNNNINILLTHKYSYYKGNGNISLNLRSSSIFSDFNYSYLQLKVINNTRLRRLLLRTRSFAQVGVGDVPYSSALFFSGGNPEDMMNSPWVRSKGFFPSEWASYGNKTNHFHFGGGLNLRGYNGYKIIERSNSDSLFFLFRGSTGMSFNAELDFGRLFPIKIKPIRDYIHIDPYLFGDAGIMNLYEGSEAFELSDIRFDAGFGACVNIKISRSMNKIKPIRLRFDFPVFLSHVPYEEGKNLMFRWLIGLGRAF